MLLNSAETRSPARTLKTNLDEYCTSLLRRATNVSQSKQKLPAINKMDACLRCGRLPRKEGGSF